MIEINRNPGRRDLLIFGGLLGIFTILAGLVAHFLWALPVTARWIWIVGSGLCVLHFAVPPLRRFIYLGWMFAVYPIGWVISHVLLAVVFFAILTPTGLVLRIFGYDPMSRRDGSDGRRTYWESYEVPNDAERYFRQF